MVARILLSIEMKHSMPKSSLDTVWFVADELSPLVIFQEPLTYYRIIGWLKLGKVS
jgi:hypothetical protein